MARMSTCMRSFCGYFSRRRSNNADWLLDQADSGQQGHVAQAEVAAEATLAFRELPSERGMRQVQAIRREFSELQTAMSGAPGTGIVNDEALQSIQRRLEDLEAILEAGCCRTEDASGLDIQRLREVSSSRASSSQDGDAVITTRGSGRQLREKLVEFCRFAWCTRRRRGSSNRSSIQEGKSEAPVLAPLVGEELVSSAQACENDPSASLVQTCENDPSASITQACEDDPSASIVSIESGGGDPSDPTSVAGCPLWSELRRCGMLPTVELRPLHTCVIPDKSLSLEQIWTELSRNDEEWPVAKAFRAVGVIDMSMTPWELLNFSSSVDDCHGDGHRVLVRRLHLRLPIKHKVPMAPKSTRVSIVFHLQGGSEGKPVVLTDHSTSWDVPYGACFNVQNQTSFSVQPGAEGGISAIRSLGFLWHQRVMMKGVIEKFTRLDVIDDFKILLNLLTNSSTCADSEAA